MKVKVRYNDKLLNALSWFMKVGGITLFPFIILRERFRDGSFYSKLAPRIIRHESIHIEQQKQLLIIFFYPWYLIEWIIRLFMKGNAYKNISMEKEAYANRDVIGYLDNRPFWAFLKYL